GRAGREHQLERQDAREGGRRRRGAGHGGALRRAAGGQHPPHTTQRTLRPLSGWLVVCGLWRPYRRNIWSVARSRSSGAVRDRANASFVIRLVHTSPRGRRRQRTTASATRSGACIIPRGPCCTDFFTRLRASEVSNISVRVPTGCTVETW